MEPEYLDEPLINRPVNKISSMMSNLFKKFKTKDIPIKKRGGLNEITELREQTADLLKIPIGQVYGLTKGWSKDTLRDNLKTCNNFINPAALWWSLYNKNKNEYKQRSNKVPIKNREERRKKYKEEDAQGLLF